jgi:aminoglycoside 6'-N-acetyltransferase I
MIIRPAEEADKGSWERMRESLWPSEPGRHAREIERYFAGQLREPIEVLLAFEDDNQAVGFIELSIRAYAEGCVSDHVAFIEGWFVEPAARGRHIGAALVSAAESWGRSQGCVELGSDAEVENLVSAAAHRALGFEETGVVRCFRKSLGAEGI